jgi:hypothetical protein
MRTRARRSIDDFIEILNTYYFRNPKTGKALDAWRCAGGANFYFPLPRPTSRFVILGWGIEHNESSEAAVLAARLMNCGHILIPDSSAKVTIKSGAALIPPVTPPPATPSWILRRSILLKPEYIHNLARHIR